MNTASKIAIIATTDSYGPETRREVVFNAEAQRSLQFASLGEARAWIEQNSGNDLGHNQSSPTSYSTTQVGSTRFLRLGGLA